MPIIATIIGPITPNAPDNVDATIEPKPNTLYKSSVKTKEIINMVISGELLLRPPESNLVINPIRVNEATTYKINNKT